MLLYFPLEFFLLPQSVIMPLPQHVINRFSLSSVHAQSRTESGRSNAFVIVIYPFGCILNTIYFPFPTIPKFDATLTANRIGSMRENFTDIPHKSDLKPAEYEGLLGILIKVQYLAKISIN